VSRVVREHLRGNIVGYVALFVALSGVAYAANAVPKNSVSSSSIKKGGVKSSDVANEALTGTDVNEATLSEVPRAGLLDGLDSSAFLQDTDTAGGDLGGLFSNLDIGAGAVDGGELSPTAVRPQNVAPNGTAGVSGTVPIMYVFAIDDGNDVSQLVQRPSLVTHAWALGVTADPGAVQVEGPGDAGITVLMDPSEDSLTPTTSIDSSNWDLDAGDLLTVDANNTQVDTRVVVLTVPNVAP
jgi:hypothetical protein